MVVNQLATCSNTRECVIVLSRPTPQFTHGDNFSQHTGVGKIVGLKKNCQACGVLEKIVTPGFNKKNYRCLTISIF